MKTQQINKNNLQVGSKLDVYYGDGSFNCQAIVTKISEKSCYLSNYGGHRESWNTVNTKIKEGIYKIVRTDEMASDNRTFDRVKIIRLF